MKNIFILLFLAFCSIVILNSCKGGTESGDNYKDPLTMTWTCDTLMYTYSVQTMLTSIYASSAGNVWASGHCDDSRGDLWRFNGSQWSVYNLFNDISSSSISLHRLLGFSQDNIWLVGERNLGSGSIYIYKPLILNYRNNKWNEVTPTINNLSIRIISICGNSSNDLWMGSDNGVLLHNNNSQWTLDTIKMKIPSTTGCSIGYMVMYKDKPFIMVGQNDGTLGYIKAYYYTGSEKNWQLLDSTVYSNSFFYSNGGDEGMYVSKSGRLYSYGDYGVWEWVNNKWSQIFNGNHFIAGMNGAGDNYIFAVGNSSYFYNGSKWTKLDFLDSKNGNSRLYTDVWTDGKEVFITGYNTGGFPNRTYIWHGK